MLYYRTVRACSSVDRAPDSGSGCRGFNSLHARLYILINAMCNFFGGLEFRSFERVEI